MMTQQIDPYEAMKLKGQVETARVALIAIADMDIGLVWTGGSAPEPSHEEMGELGKLADTALRALSDEVNDGQ